MTAKKGKRKINLQDLKPRKDAKGGISLNTPGAHNPGGHNPGSHGPTGHQPNRFFGP